MAAVMVGAQPWILESPARLGLVRRLEQEFPAIEQVGCKVASAWRPVRTKPLLDRSMTWMCWPACRPPMRAAPPDPRWTRPAASGGGGTESTAPGRSRNRAGCAAGRRRQSFNSLACRPGPETQSLRPGRLLLPRSGRSRIRPSSAGCPCRAWPCRSSSWPCRPATDPVPTRFQPVSCPSSPPERRFLSPAPGFVLSVPENCLSRS